MWCTPRSYVTTKLLKSYIDYICKTRLSSHTLMRDWLLQYNMYAYNIDLLVSLLFNMSKSLIIDEKLNNKSFAWHFSYLNLSITLHNKYSACSLNMIVVLKNRLAALAVSTGRSRAYSTSGRFIWLKGNFVQFRCSDRNRTFIYIASIWYKQRIRSIPWLINLKQSDIT